MFATKISNLTDARRKVLVDIQADAEPAALPASGADVSNLADDVAFEVGSSLFIVPTGNAYLWGEDEKWHLVAENA